MNMVVYKGSRVVGLVLDMKGGQCSLQTIYKGVLLFVKPFVKGIVELCYLGTL